MRSGGWLFCGLASVLLVGGCASMDDYRRVRAANMSLTAEKESMAQELFDCRSATDSLRTRVASLDSELQVKTELITNLRKENELLDEMRLAATQSLEGLAGRQQLGQITIARLPEPLDSAIKQFAEQHPGAVEYDAERGIVKWKSDLLFALGSDVVRDTSLESLQGFTQILMSPAAGEFEALVVGHTDTRRIAKPETMSKHPTNWHLSAHRAISVANALSKYGYDARRIGVMGYGEFRPVADNASEAGASQNRRVEIYLIPRGAIAQASARQDSEIRGVAISAP